MTQELAVIIVSFNRRDDLRLCLAALSQSSQRVEVIVVDNASADGSAEMVRHEFPSVALVANETNLGFAAACNLGARTARGKLLLFLNSDVRARPGAIGRLVEYMDSHDFLSGCCGHLVNPDGSDQVGFNVRRLPTPTRLFLEMFLPPRLMSGVRSNRNFHARDFDYRRDGPVEQPAAACLLLRAEVYRSLGGMDEEFHPAWWEDVDLCRRLKDGGHTLYYVHDALFEHSGSGRLFGYDVDLRDQARAAALMPRFYRNQILYVKKHHGAAASFMVRVAVAFGMLLRIPAAQGSTVRKLRSSSQPVRPRALLAAARPYLGVIRAMLRPASTMR